MRNILYRLIPAFIFNLYRDWKYGEKKKSYGNEDPDKTFYIIGFTDMNAGLFWLVNKALMHIGYAEDKGYIPVVDYKNNKTQYTGDDEFGTINVWEKFFNQPAGYRLEDVKNKKNIVIGCKYPSPDSEHFMGHFYDEPNKILYFRDLYKKYISYPDDVKLYLESCKALIKNKGKVLGVLCRGTDYVSLKPGGHPIPPPLDLVIEKSKEVMREYNCNYLFLATEDQDVYQRFLFEFGERLIVNHQKRVSKSQLKEGQVLSQVRMEQSKSAQERYVSGLEYLAAIEILANCNCFVGVRCGGTKAALILSEGFEYEFTFNLGLYQ